jgi:hypothetical protein
MKARYAPLALIVASCGGFTLALGQAQVASIDNRIFIASVTGEWVHVSSSDPTHATRPASFGQPVNDTDCLYGKTGAVVVQEKGQLLPYSCDVPHRENACSTLHNDPAMLCSVRIGTKPAKATEGTFARWFNSIENRLQADPNKYMTAASRGLEAELDEAVVPLTGTQLDLGAVFKDMDDGDYSVVLAPVSRGGPAGRPLHLRYKRGASALVSAAGIVPALYNVILTDQSGAPLGNEAWALARSPSNYAAASSDFAQLVAASQKWPEEMDSSATRAILRAYLDQLADQK